MVATYGCGDFFAPLFKNEQRFSITNLLANYLSESQLRSFVLELVQFHAPSCRDLKIERLPGPFRPNNWHVTWLDVLAEHYAAARDQADLLEETFGAISVPDGHQLNGQVYGKEHAVSDAELLGPTLP